MKKLFTLAFALVFSAGIAFAQNSLTVDQQGDDNTVEAISGATQDASAGGSNAAAITQIAGVENDGDPTGGHQAFISQVSAPGDQNVITLTQSFGTNALGPRGAQTATLSQNGEGNMIDGFQNSRSSRVANVNQEGNDNMSTFENGRDLDVDQLGDRNVAESFGSSDGPVTQYQDGDDNYARNVGNGAYQYQEGDYNTAVSTSFVSGTATSQTQVGDHNESYFRDLRGGSSNSATSVQTGNYNVVDAYWNQNGSNVLDITQTSSMTAGPSDGNYASIDFQSTGNTVMVTQDGLSNKVISIQK